MRTSSRFHAGGWMKVWPNMFSLSPKLGCSLRESLVLDYPHNVFVEASWTSGWHYGPTDLIQKDNFYSFMPDFGRKTSEVYKYCLKKSDYPIKQKWFSLAEKMNLGIQKRTMSFTMLWYVFPVKWFRLGSAQLPACVSVGKGYNLSFETYLETTKLLF